jgi:hypothetical protein
MLKIFKVGQWTLEVDVTKTEGYYNRELIEDCSCTSCQNYRLHKEFVSESILNFFQQFGLKPFNGGEYSEFGINEAKLIMYQGNYPIVGRIIDGSKTIIKNWNENELIENENYQFGFSDEHLTPIPRDFPDPIIELHFTTIIPWRHEEPYQ